MQSENCWVWFKGAMSEKGYWKGGFTCERDEKPGVVIKSPSFVTCRVPEWRISNTEPKDKNMGPEIPPNAIWKII